MILVEIGYFLSCFICFGFVNAYFQSSFPTEHSLIIRIILGTTLSMGGPISLLVAFLLAERFHYGWFLGEESKRMRIERVESRLDGEDELSYFGDR